MGSAYRVEIARSAMKEVEHLPPQVQVRIRRAVTSLAVAPTPRGVRKLVGTDDLYRLRIGDYRVIYRVVDSERFVDVIHVRHRREAYQ